LRIESSAIRSNDLEEFARKLAKVESLSEEDIGHMLPEELSGVKSQ
jgi:hypothetical protein